MTSSIEVAVIILAAGFGTRMHSEKPKVLHKLAGRSMLSHLVHTTTSIPNKRVIVVVGYKRTSLISEINRLSAKLKLKIDIAIQDDQFGTGHALACGINVLPLNFNGLVLSFSSDIPMLDDKTLNSLIRNHNISRASTSFITTTIIEPKGYGRIHRKCNGKIIKIIEDSDAKKTQLQIKEVNAGVYIFNFIDLCFALKQLVPNNLQYEFYLTDVVSILSSYGLTIQAVNIKDSNLVTGVNNRFQLSKLNAEFNHRIVIHHQLAGVTIVDPKTTWIDIDVEIGRDTIINPNTQLFGKCKIGTKCKLGPDSTLIDVEVGSNVSVVRTHGNLAIIGSDSTIGPFTHLRPGTILGNKVKIGSFVETKDSTIGDGTKISHITYVGDTDIGRYSNIGASSVFVNYDGKNKYKTKVGSCVRTGANTMFVAPIKVGDGAYTGAGAILREDVPPNALAVSHNTQRNIKNWVQYKRPKSNKVLIVKNKTYRKESNEQNS